MFENYKNVIIITNNDECKFEIGAYNVGIKYLIANNLIENYHYYVFTQDNFVLKNKYDFNFLLENNIHACPIHNWSIMTNDEKKHWGSQTTNLKIMRMLNLENFMNELSICWCNSFVLHKSKISDFFGITKDIIIKIRFESECSERYLSAILYHLNNKKKDTIDGCISNLQYDCWKVNIFDNDSTTHFVKKIQQKNENTVDIPP